MLHSKPELVKLAVTIASDAGIDPALVCAHIDCRSRWDSGLAVPVAISYLTHQNFPEPLECEHRSIVWGLMGIQGEFARSEAFAAPLPSLLSPETNIAEGCRLFLRLMQRKIADPVDAIVDALLNWNRSPDRALVAETLGKLEAYRELIGRMPSEQHTFQHDDTIPQPERLQIEGNLLEEVGASTHTRMRP
jgi:hypothetical protein